MEKQLLNLEDIKLLVDSFYGKVQEDDMLAPIFNRVIEDRWPEHLAKMYTFWQTVLLSEHTYYGSPFPPHSKLPITKEHFDRWLKLFFETVKENFEGEKADEAQWRASKMAEIFQFKIDQYRENGSRPFV